MLVHHIVWWQTALVVIIASCACFLAMMGAVVICEKIEPLEGSPKEHSVPMISVPLGFGVVAGAVTVHTGGFYQILLATILLVVLASAWASDAKRGLVLDYFVYPGLIAVVVTCFFMHDFHALVAGAVIAIVFGVLAFVSKGRGMGWGDVKLAALGTCVVGLSLGITALIVACLVVSLVAFARKRAKEPMAFAPFMAASFAIALAFPNPGVI